MYEVIQTLSNYCCEFKRKKSMTNEDYWESCYCCCNRMVLFVTRLHMVICIFARMHFIG